MKTTTNLWFESKMSLKLMFEWIMKFFRGFFPTEKSLAQSVRVETCRDDLFTKFGIVRLKDSYMRSCETSPQERFAFIAKKLGSNPEHAQRIYNYASQHWLSFSTPILSLGRAKHGLPISCYLSFLPDTREGLVNTLSEVNQLSMLGGGVGIGVNLRSADEKSTGVMCHLNTYDACSMAYKQDEVRRGSYAVYLRVDDPAIVPFLEMRKPTGDHNIRCLNLHHGVVITDNFMELIERCINDPKCDDSWPLIDRHSSQIKEVVSARKLWETILETRVKRGEPYLFFEDTCNESMPSFQKEIGLKCSHSGLCAEIILPTNEERTAICCLSSLNLEYFEEWKNDPLFVRDVAEMLDNALELFITTAPKTIARAVFSARKERSIGIGVLGWHALLQSQNLSMESPEAKTMNESIFSLLKQKVDAANLELGALRGEPEDAKGTGRRFCCTMAIAPNATSSIIMGNTSPGIEPFRANAYRQDTKSGFNLNKNKFLDKLLKTKNVDVDEAWNNILANDGSVQHLSFLTRDEKNVFKTAFEINQHVLIELAADRQKFIDQGQSLNLFLLPDVSRKELHRLHFDAWKLKLKTLYYCRSTKISPSDTLRAVKACPMRKPGSTEECIACE